MQEPQEDQSLYPSHISTAKEKKQLSPSLVHLVLSFQTPGPAGPGVEELWMGMICGSSSTVGVSSLYTCVYILCVCAYVYMHHFLEGDSYAMKKA